MTDRIVFDFKYGTVKMYPFPVIRNDNGNYTIGNSRILETDNTGKVIRDEILRPVQQIRYLDIDTESNKWWEFWK